MEEEDYKHGLSDRHISQIIRRKMMERTYSSKKNYSRKKLKRQLKKAIDEEDKEINYWIRHC